MPSFAFVVLTCTVLLSACGPTAARETAVVPPSSTPAQVEVSAATPRREVVVGQMCPDAAEGRPALLPLVVRTLSWSDDKADVADPLARRSARSFSVLAWDGRRVGAFQPIGMTRIDRGRGERDVAIGSYAGAPPCQIPAAGAAEPELDPACKRVLDGCGVAVAVLEPGAGFEARPYEEDPPPPDFRPAGACAVDDKLLVDIDGDHVIEAYDLRQFVDPMRAPAEEVGRIDVGTSSCQSAFAFAGAIAPGDPRDWRGMDVLGVLDLDGDGRRELVLAFRYQSKVTWVIYSATTTPARLDRVAEAVAF